MEEIIKKLIEVDKSARERVEKAQAKKADVVGEIDSKRSEMKKSTEEAFALRSQQIRQQAYEQFEKQYSQDKVDQARQEAIRELENSYSQNREKWVREIFERITDDVL